MTYSFLRGFSLILVLAALFGYVGCSGTNTGNGTAAGTGGAGYNLGTANTGGAPNTGGAANTGGTQGACPYLPCSYPVNVTGSDGTTYRGRIIPDISIASYSYAQSLPNPPVAELSFSGSEVDLSDAGCQVIESGSGQFDQVQIFISTADSSIDASGTLHVRSAGRNDMYAAGPGNIYEPSIPGWAVDLTVTADGQLTAALSSASADSLDAGETAQALNISGHIDPSCVPGPNGQPIPASMPVSGGGTFNFPCWQRTGCGD